MKNTLNLKVGMIISSILIVHQQSISATDLEKCKAIAFEKIEKEKVCTLYELLRYDDRLDIAMLVAIHDLVIGGMILGVSPYDISKANIPANMMFYETNRN
jgi:hypothetical protein